MTPVIRRLATAVTLAVLLAGAGPVALDPAGAHGEQGLMELTATAGADGTTVDVRARLVYASDADPASDATVTVDATGPAGQTVTPVAMTSRGDGVYTASLALPTAGAWTVRASAATPTATAEIVVDTTRASPSTTIPDPEAGGSTAPPARPSTDDAGGSDWVVPVLFVVVLVLLAVGLVAAIRSRRRPGMRE